MHNTLFESTFIQIRVFFKFRLIVGPLFKKKKKDAIYNSIQLKSRIWARNLPHRVKDRENIILKRKKKEILCQRAPK